MLKVLSPYDQSLIKEIPLVGKAEVEKALATAYDLFQNQSKWIPAYERIAILERTAEIMKTRIEELTKTATQEGGKPLVDSRIEVLRAINGVKIAAEHISQLKGEQIPMGLTKASENRIAFTTREPIGVVSSISAFNHPLNLIIHQVVTAIAAGCPVIIKPALST
ncbi:MAG: aldehyde dehydrogenase family protein, partial [Flavobacteriales bacterium]|nr:aldehyde dehydrogenase family protein [Flavobacteriales bacterium]